MVFDYSVDFNLHLSTEDEGRKKGAVLRGTAPLMQNISNYTLITAQSSFTASALFFSPASSSG
ncbi:MAG TPA: hypothetical protein VN151_10485, partial [Terracidiphilus sp.]|nr:hypothetical protein [Terracidiphilus sp.]